MKITPLEIRQKTFEKNFRGYEKDEVHGFLLTLSQEWERMQDENKELRIKLESAEREVSKLREVEGSLYKTLKTAEDTGANVIEQSRKTAELHLKESQLRAEALMNEAKSKAKDMIEESEMRAKQIIADMEDRLKSLIDNYKKLESSREDLMSDLRRLGTDLLERVERARQNVKDFDADKHLYTVKREAKRAAFPNLGYERVKTESARQEEQDTSVQDDTAQEPEPAVVEAQSRKSKKSFFDEIS